MSNSNEEKMSNTGKKGRYDMGKTTICLIKILILIVPILHGCTHTQYATHSTKQIQTSTQKSSDQKQELQGNLPPLIPDSLSSLRLRDQKKDSQESFPQRESDGFARLHHMERYLNTLIEEGGTEAQITSCRRMLDELQAELYGEERNETSNFEQSSDDNETTEPINDDVLIKGTIAYAKDLVVPPYDVQISYDKDKKSVYIKFKTPLPYKLKDDFSDIHDRWRNNQWVVLQEFKKAHIPVANVTVETNLHDMSGIMKVTHSAEHIDKYEKLADDNMWLRTATIYIREIGSDKWERIDE